MRAARRQLALLEPREEHRLELEPFRPVQRQEVDAAAGARPEALLQARRELRDRAFAVVELLREPHEAREVGLPRLLPLAELLGRAFRASPPPPGEREPLPQNLGRATVPERLDQTARRVTREQRRTLERNAGVVERLLEVGRARVRPHEHRLILERDPDPARARTRSVTSIACSSGVLQRRSSGSGPSPSVGRNVFSAPPSFGTSRFASASTCGVER